MIKNIIKNKTLYNKTILITGTTSGIGLACIKHLAKVNANIISCSRNTDLATNQLNQLKSKYPDLKFSVYHLDLQNLKSVNKLFDSLRKDFPSGIDYIINNAGIFSRPKKKTEYGFEQHFFTNCVAPLYLTKKLTPLLNKNSRVVFVSSISIKNSKINFEEIDFNSINNNIKIYANSKLWLTNYILHHNKTHPDNGTKFILIQPGICSSSLLNPKNGSLSKFVFAICNIGMKILFHSSSKAALCEIAGLTLTPKTNEWIGPRVFGVWGSPKAAKLVAKNAKPEIEQKCYETLENIVNKL